MNKTRTLKVKRIPKSKVYRLLLCYCQNNSGEKIITQSIFRSIPAAKEGAYSVFDTFIKENFPDATNGGLIMASDMVCTECGKSHDLVKNKDGLLVAGYMTGDLENGWFRIEIIKEEYK
ncbi:MAG: hypothetical protein P4L45_09850 [Ignavibacteriaceae bacterium]|nr:hypothetical protein [Ignavibacteriaceae bacterium]